MIERVGHLGKAAVPQPGMPQVAAQCREFTARAEEGQTGLGPDAVFPPALIRMLYASGSGFRRCGKFLLCQLADRPPRDNRAAGAAAARGWLSPLNRALYSGDASQSSHKASSFWKGPFTARAFRCYAPQTADPSIVSQVYKLLREGLHQPDRTCADLGCRESTSVLPPLHLG